MSRRQVAWNGVLWAARIATAAGLVIDAYVHLDLASLYAEGGGTINEGVLFRAEAVVASLVAVAIIAAGRRVCYLAGLVVAASALAAMLVSRYIDLGQIGPFPDLYDPAWYPEKLLAAYAEGAAVATALAGVIMTSLAGKSRPVAPLGGRQETSTNQQEDYHHDKCLQQAVPPSPRGWPRWSGGGRTAGCLRQRKQQHRGLGRRGQRPAEERRQRNGL
jgi:hypothetical protein